MDRYAVFIEPQGDLRDVIVAWKRRVEETWPDQPYCCHPPHSTLIVSTLTAPDEWLRELVLQVAEIKAFGARVSDTIVFYDDSMTGGHSMAFRMESSQALRHLQRTVGDALAPYVCRPQGALPDAFKAEPFRSSYDQYGFPFVGDHWIPHFSVASPRVPRDNALIAEFQELRPDYPFAVAEASLWRVQGDTHSKIATLPLKDKQGDTQD